MDILKLIIFLAFVFLFYSYIKETRKYRTIWDRPEYRSTHNCYAYAFKYMDPQLTEKLQPGEVAHIETVPATEYNCDTLIPNIMRDFPEAQILHNSTETCPRDYYKIALYVDKGIDYHLYRQERDGYWSHKLGNGYVKWVDANGEKIKDPATANRNYGKYNYTTPCATICYPNTRK